MKFTLDKNSIKQLKRLFKTNKENMLLGDLYSDFITNQNLNKQTIQKYQEANDKEKEIFLQMADTLDLDLEDSEMQSFVRRTNLNNIRPLDPIEYLNNPYYKNIQLKNLFSLNFTFKKQRYLPYECFVYKDTTFNNLDYYLEITHLGYFKQTFEYLVLFEKNIPWMSITPNEIETMKEPISLANGKVLTFGLGLAYYTYMVLFNNKIEKIRVIEKSKTLIDLFTKNLLNQFPNKQKLEVYQADQFDLNKVLPLIKNSDFIFIDTYHTGMDGLNIYLKFKSIEKNYPNIKFYYWIENSILAIFRRLIIDLMEEEFNNYNLDYTKEENEFDHIANKLHYLLINKQFSSYEEIFDFLNINNLKELAKQIY